ncbi:hypothetical protein G7Z17_g10992 [Cylindrodendrum hubeiense]|uniref:Uncharacterized protein n=1 Tax=Cylindrodendrum hubeiense TaxID=595255 RepID=A0A9P5H4U6_9HYPO|nr:hypothetical protein G7Z17_g10992 [Cylindrodendrum hubeiense]
MAAQSHVLILPPSLQSLSSPAVIMPDAGSGSFTAMSYAQLTTLTCLLQKSLAKLGITRASKVALVLPNGIEFVAVFLAAVRQRAIAAPVNPQFTKNEYSDIFSMMQPDLVITVVASPSHNNTYSHAPAVLAAQEQGFPVALCCRSNKEDPVLQISLDLIGGDTGTATATTPSAVFSRNEVESEDKALLLFTSGTTGKPKSVLLSHTNLLVAMRIIIAAHKLSAEDRCLIITPLCHVIGIGGSLLTTLFTGGCTVIPPSLPGAFWQCCADFGITWYHAVPTLHRLLISFPRPNGIMPPTLRFIRCGGSDMPPDLYDGLQSLGLPVLEVYGMTESAPAIFCNRLEEEDDTRARKLAHYPIADAVEVMILPLAEALRQSNIGISGAATTDHNALSMLTKEPGVIGEVCLRGKSIMSGYTNNPTANTEAFLANGYFRTGDLGAIQPQQRLIISGRVKEIINKAGEKISPAEIEHVALTHGGVKEAACFRVPDKMYGECIGLAVVIRAESGQVTAADIKKHFRKNAALFKTPDKDWKTEKNLHCGAVFTRFT